MFLIQEPGVCIECLYLRMTVMGKAPLEGNSRKAYDENNCAKCKVTVNEDDLQWPISINIQVVSS